MKTSALIMAFGLAAMLSACGSDKKNENPTGSWTATAPTTVTTTVEGAKSATKTISFDFTSDGAVTYSADYDVTADSISYKVTASVQGTYKLEPKEDDDYIVAFDTNTLKVEGTDAPELGPVTDEFISSMAQFTSIEDVKVSKDGTTMTFEAGHPDVKYSFIKK